MLGGITILGILGLIAHSFSKYGVEKITKAVVKESMKTKTKDEVIAEINKYPITKDLKLKIVDYVQHC